MTQQYGPPGPQQPADEGWSGHPPPAPVPWQSGATPELLAAPSAGLPFGLTGADGKSALGMVARAFLPVLLPLTVLVAVLAHVALPDGHGGSLADWLRTAVVLLALSMGGRAVVDGSATVQGASAEMSVGFRLIPLTITLVLFVLMARAAARAERQDPSTGRAQLGARALVVGVTAGLALAAAAVLGRTSELYGVDLTAEFGGWSGGIAVGAGVPGTLLGTVLLVSLAGVLGRTWASASRPGPVTPPVPVRGGELRTALRILRTFAVGLLVTGAAFFLVALLYLAAVGNDLDGNRLQELAAVLGLGLNAVLALCLGALGVPLALGASGAGQRQVWLGGLDGSVGSGGSGGHRSLTLLDHPPALLALLLPVALLLCTAVRRSLREPVLPMSGRAVRPAAAVGFVAGLAGALLLRISSEASGSGGMPVAGDVTGSGAASVGPSLLWAPLICAAWAALAVWLVHLGPTLALSLPVRVPRAIAGRGIRPDWAAALAGTAPAPAGRRSPALRRGLVAVAGLALLAVALLVGVAAVNALVYTPEVAAEEYLAAVAAADPEGVVEQLRIPPALPGPLLDRNALRSDDFTAISDVSVGKAEVSGDHATVHVSYLVGDRTVDDTIELVTAEPRYGLLRTWKVAEALPMVELMPQLPLGAAFAGHPMSDGGYPALPGQYTFRAAPHPMLTAEAVPVLVTTDAVDEPPQMVPELRDGVLESAQRAVLAEVERCASRTELPAAGCAFLSNSWNRPDLTDVTVHITTMPTFSFVLDESGSLIIVTETEGELTLTGTETVPSFFGEPEQQRPYEDDVTFALDGSVIGSGSDMVVTLE
jgi:hypothetical protein